MVKKNKETNILEKQITNLSQDLEEDFVKANDYITNEVLNEDEDNLNDFEERDDILIEKLKSLEGKRSKRQRTEVVKGELDVNITTKNDPNSVHKIKTYELLNSLKDVSEAGALKKLFSKTHSRTKVLDTPLPKHLTEKAQRMATYTENKKDISKWDPVIKRNRAIEQLVFPLKQPDYSMQPASTFTKTWKPETDLEKQVAELLETSENNLKDQKLLTQAELKAIQTMSLDEMKQKRAEFLKLRALQSYQESKFKRLKHIKSKRYRKILKKQREKEEMKAMEGLEKEDPLKFKEVLQQMEKDRMKERMSLKHKNTSKWAKQQNIYGKYNDAARQQVQDQLEISKKLTKKLKQFEVDQRDDEDEEEKNEKENNQVINIKNGLLENNPWMKMMNGVGGLDLTTANKDKQSQSNQDDDYAKPKAYVNKKEIEKTKEEIENADEDDLESDEEIIDRSNLKDVIGVLKDDDESENENDNENKINDSQKNDEKNSKKILKKQNKELKNKKETKKDNKTINEDSFESVNEKNKNLVETKTAQLNIKPISHDISFNKVETNGEIEPDSNITKKTNNRQSNSKQHQITLSEAFADDDVIEEFKAEKRAIEENERVKPIDLTMPGWGGWAGAGIDPNEIKKTHKKRNRRLRKKLIITPKDVFKTQEEKQELIRRDKDLEHVIISEKKDTRIAEYQINQLPHQFNNIHDFENKIAQPIGRTWNPDYKFRKLIMPKVKTKMGSVIEPIDKDDLIKKIKK